MKRFSPVLALVLVLALFLGPPAVWADHGDPSTREAGVPAPFDPKAAVTSLTREVADHQVTVSHAPQALAPQDLVRFALTIKQKGSGENYSGEVKFTLRPAGGAGDAFVLPLASAADAWTGLFVFDRPGAYEATVEFTPIPAPGAATAQITKKTVTFPLSVGANQPDLVLPLLGGVVLVALVLLWSPWRRK